MISDENIFLMFDGGLRNFRIKGFLLLFKFIYLRYLILLML